MQKVIEVVKLGAGWLLAAVGWIIVLAIAAWLLIVAWGVLTVVIFEIWGIWL